MRASNEGERARTKAEVDDDIVLSGGSMCVEVREGQWRIHKRLMCKGIESEVLVFLQDRPFTFIGSSETTINKDDKPSTMTRRF